MVRRPDSTPAPPPPQCRGANQTTRKQAGASFLDYAACFINTNDRFLISTHSPTASSFSTAPGDLSSVLVSLWARRDSERAAELHPDSEQFGPYPVERSQRHHVIGL